MKLLYRFVGAIIANGMALWVASLLIVNFKLTYDLKAVFFASVILTILNFTIRPILKLILAPIIFLTLGLGLLVVNGIILYLLDKLSPDLSIQGIPALIYAVIVIGAVNLVFHIFTRS